MVDTGYFTADERDAHGKLRPDVVTKNDWALNAYTQFPVDVFNVSSHDLRYFSDLLAKAGAGRRTENESTLSRLVSANAVYEQTGSQLVKPFIVREVQSRQGGPRPVRIAFIGLSENTPDPPRGLKFIDPVEAARRTVPEARKLADLVVVLAKVRSQQQVSRIAQEAPGIDIIIDGNAGSLEEVFTPPFYVGTTLIVFTPYETRMIGELRFYRDAAGKFSTKQRFIALDEILVPEDPDAKQVVDAAAKAESDARSKSSTALERWLESSRMRAMVKPQSNDLSRIGSSGSYVTSAACSQCHIDQYLAWSKSAHAHATNPLPARPFEFEMRCLDCHATGARQGSVNEKPEPALFQNVQCEQCHGPGSSHAAKPAKGYGRVADIKTSCARCHTPETSPSFDFQNAWAMIKH